MIEIMIKDNNGFITAAQVNGFITAAQVTAAGIQRRTLSELVVAKRLYRVARGIYALYRRTGNGGRYSAADAQ